MVAIPTNNQGKGSNVSTIEVATVRVWFGDTPIRSLSTDDPKRADEYVAAMSRQFAGLRVTRDDHEADDRQATGGPSVPLPANSALWPLTVK